MSHISKYFKPLHAIPGLIIGILAYYTPTLGYIATICFIIGFGIALCMGKKIAPLRHLILMCMVWSFMGWVAAWYEMRPFRILYKDQPYTVQLTGIIMDYSYCSHIRYPHRFTVAIDTVICDGTARYPEGSLHLYTNHRGTNQPYPIGSFLTVDRLKLKPPTEPFAHYLIKEGLLGSAFVSHTALQAVRTKSEGTLLTWLTNTRTQIVNSVTQKLSSEEAALFNALFLGNKVLNKKAIDTVQTQFKFWGVAHIFARSGMHISMIIGIILFLLFLLPLPYTLKVICATLIGLLYALLSWSTISFTRALIMFLWSNYCIIARRYSSTLHLLGITTMLVLLWHPLNLFFLDFQLSFALTGALIWICSYLVLAR